MENGLCVKSDLSGLLVDFKHREIDDITELETVFIDEIQALRHLGADLSAYLATVSARH